MVILLCSWRSVHISAGSPAVRLCRELLIYETQRTLLFPSTTADKAPHRKTILRSERRCGDTMLPHILSVAALLASALAAPVEIPSKQYVVENLPGLEGIAEADRPLMYAGHIELDAGTETNYFFWKFVKPQTDFNRTIIWLNGGPGCSSMDGAMMESGPLRVNSTGGLYANKGSWYEAGNMVFVDQPGGTGFSITKSYDKDLDKVGTDFVTFLQNYFKVFPEDIDKELYISGESYAGQYIPVIADAIFTAMDNGDLPVNLKGLLIGNGWIDPNSQSMSYIPYLLDAGIIHQDDSFFQKLLKQQEKCQNEVNDGKSKDKFSLSSCENILNYILSDTRDKEAPKDQQCINMYDTRLRDSYPSCGMNWPQDLPFVQPWLQRDEVVESLNLDVTKVKKWRECDNDVSRFLTNKHSKPSIGLLPGLLERVPIVLFNGDKDIICNNYGVKSLIDNLSWGGSKGFDVDAVEYPWFFKGENTGSVKSSKNLTFIDVYDSSHMVPFDKPEDSRGVFDFFVGNFRVVDGANNTFVETPVYDDGSFIWSGDNSEDSEPSDSDQDTKKGNGSVAGSGKSATPFILYLMVIGVLGSLLFYFTKDKGPKGNSILKTHSNRKKPHTKKTVSWADNTPQTTQHGSKVGDFLNNYSTTKKGYHSFGADDENYEDIELQNQNIQEDFDFDIEDEDIGDRR